MTPAAPTATELLRTAVGRVALASATDGDLVRRYATDRDDLAFAELVHRFAPAVYALCRRHLSDPGTADDSFQAVFVLLARKADTLVYPDRVGGWLVGVADRVARTARRRQARRNESLRPLETVPEPAAPLVPVSDLRAILDDELAKLPPHYRAVVLMCDVDGVPRREAATRLGIPTGTLSNRLTRARAVLGRRLLRRGVLVAGGAVLSGGTAANASPNLLAVAVRVALSDAPPPTVLSLIRQEMPPMPRGKLLMLLVGGLVLTGAATTGVVLLGLKPTTDGEQAKDNKPDTPTTSAVSPADAAKWPQPKPRLPQDDTGAFAFSPDGRWFARARNYGAEDAKLSVIDTTTWEEVAAIDFKQLEDIVSAVAVSADGKRVFLRGYGIKGGIRVWDTIAKKFEEKQFVMGAERPGLRLKLSPDGSTLVGWVGQNRSKVFFRVWDAKTGAVLSTIDLPEGVGERFTFADGGKVLSCLAFSGHYRNPKCELIEWELDTGKQKRRIDLRTLVDGDRGPPTACAVAYTPDGKQMIIGGGFVLPEVKLAEAKPDTVVSNYPWSGSVWVIDRESGKLVKTLIDHRHSLVRELHTTVDGKKLIVQPPLPSRWDRIFSANGGMEDEEFVELQQWDVATWELDWVKIVPKTERWKLWNGAAK